MDTVVRNGGDHDHVRIPVFIQARMTSRRLPGKSMLALGSSTVLGCTLQGTIQSERAGETFVLTSDQASDDPLSEWCADRKIPTIRGELDNVANRLLQGADSIRATALVRISGDSPFIDPRLIDRALALWEMSDADLVTNVFPRTYPRGQSVEVIRVEALRELVNDPALGPADAEHVTSAFYRHPKEWTIVPFGFTDQEAGAFPSSEVATLQLSVDSPEDLARAREVARSLLGPDQLRPSWIEVVRVRLALPDCTPSEVS